MFVEQKSNYSIHHEASWSFTWMHTRREQYKLFILSKFERPFLIGRVQEVVSELPLFCNLVIAGDSQDVDSVSVI